jgi:hypothetical protein
LSRGKNKIHIVAIYRYPHFSPLLLLSFLLHYQKFSELSLNPHNSNQADLFKQFQCKNTLEIARILALEFVNLFGNECGTQEQITNRLLPAGRAATYANLDRNINVFCKQFYSERDQHADKIEFLDQARFALQALPQKQDYKLPEHKSDYHTPQDLAEHFTFCSLCWRAVARHPLEKKTPLCHLHDLPSQAPEYRRRARLKKEVEALKLQLLETLPPLGAVKAELKLKGQTDLTDYLQNLCLAPDSPLIFLSKYLHSLNLPLDSPQDILQALEHPIYRDKLPPLMTEAWNFHFDDLGKHFKLAYLKLITAEAWLRTDAEHQHGGKRR